MAYKSYNLLVLSRYNSVGVVMKSMPETIKTRINTFISSTLRKKLLLKVQTGAMTRHQMAFINSEISKPNKWIFVLLRNTKNPRLQLICVLLKALFSTYLCSCLVNLHVNKICSKLATAPHQAHLFRVGIPFIHDKIFGVRRICERIL